MATNAYLEQFRLGRAMLLTLRLTVVLQCLGNWRWLTRIEETPLLHWMLNPSDVGGLGWSEATAQTVQQGIGWTVLLAGLSLLWRAHVPALAFLFVVQSLITIAMWRLAEGYPLQADWLPPQLLLLFPFAARLLRMVAPLGLLMLTWKASEPKSGQRRVSRTMQFLRWSTAIVFVAHGIEALQHNPKFIDLTMSSLDRVLGIALTEETATSLLTWIGVIDMLAAIACLSFRSMAVIGWLAFWGVNTAMSRIFAYGWELSWHETLTRAAHCGVPLAVGLWWYLLKSKQLAEVDVDLDQDNHAERKEDD